MEYTERDCTIKHEGRTFEAKGAYVDKDHARGYVNFTQPIERTGTDSRQELGYKGRQLVITDWHGKPLGYGRIGSSWPIRSYISDRMYQIYAKINGIEYTGRSCGEGMVWNGKRVRS